MPHLKKRPAHHCAAHPSTIATARCSVCKTWICGSCGKKVAHQWYCPSCSEKKTIPAQESAVETKSPPQVRPPFRQTMTMQSLVLLAGITLGLCGLMFGLWNMRAASELSAQNSVLRLKRSELLGQIKERNREIAALASRLDSIRSYSETAAPVKRNSGQKGPFLENVLPAVGNLPVSFDNGSSQKRLIALTFDGSDQSNAATEILDTLKSRDVKATMFLSGRFMQRKTDVVRRILGDGHEIGNHTFSHPHLTSFVQDHTQSTLPSVTEAFLAQELTRTDSVFQALYGSRLAPLWRSPYGDHNRTLCVWAQKAGFLHIGWGQGRTWRRNLDSNDWTPNEETAGFHTPQEVYDKIVSLAREQPWGINGGIILMHLGTVRLQKESQVHQVLGKMIDTLSSLGYRFVTVSELLHESGVDIGQLTHK
jgi:peptidoglycan/xylan/chitin deacetylase (PgdA/CDA1 family)